PRRTVSPRTLGKTYTAPDGTTFRPSLFITLTCPSYGRVDHQGVPVDPAPPGRPGPPPAASHAENDREDLHRAGRRDIPAVHVPHAHL
ncbi:MAG TPA: hypothetical protein VMK13_03670, partial [Streptosporangiaceae bacterium]|nr:hypothetical protein [Streptosporangiaceae bacterium]